MSAPSDDTQGGETEEPQEEKSNVVVSNDKTNDNVSSSPQVIVEDPNFANAMKWLLWKDLKQTVTRRPISCGCRTLLPVVFMLLLAWIRTAFKAESIDDVIFDLNDLPFGEDSRYDYSAPPSTVSYEYFSSLLCYYHQLDRTSYQSLPAYSLAIIPNPNDQTTSELSTTAFSHFTELLNILNNSYQSFSNESDLDYSECADSFYRLPFEEGWLLRYFDSETELNDYVGESDYGFDYNVSSQLHPRRPIGAAIVFDSISDDGLQWKYTLRLNVSNVPDTNEKIDQFSRDYDTLSEQSVESYGDGGFTNLQRWIDSSIVYYIAQETGNSGNEFVPVLFDNTFYDQYSPYSFPFPIASYETDDFWTSLQGLFLFFVLIQFVYPINTIISVLVEEKANKIAEGLKMMGATLSSYWISWIFWYFLEMTVIAFLISLAGIFGDVFKYSDFSVIFVWMWGFCLSLSGFGILISTLFDNPKIASLFGCVLWIITLIAGGFGQLMDETGKGWFCLISPACLNLSLVNMEEFESSLLGLQWDNIDQTYEDFKFSTAIIMFFVDYFIYITLALYCDRVWPSRYGAREPVWFFLLPSFWSCCTKQEDKSDEPTEIHKQFTMMDTPSYEDVTEKYKGRSPSIAIRHLRKYFESACGTSATVKAVDGVSLNMYEGEVFCLLGHNGAGKTTTISMLTGLLDVTGGDAWILGENIKTHMQDARKYMGVCPQHDVLFPLLTVEEHLRMYARLKGVQANQIDGEVEKTILSVGLDDKRVYYPTQLSGGQKRKLSLGIAFVGQSKVVFLDEPTSGMDPQARRVTWELIEREKKNRTIILTTHYMDEADFLGDRVAIMSNGKVRCCGSALFLKRLYGVGYTFTVSLNIGIKPSQVKPALDKTVLELIPNANALSVAGGEINYRLPFEDSSTFPDMFEAIDVLEEKESVGISSYGISVTTLEEVFLKIGHDQDTELPGDEAAKAAETQFIDDAPKDKSGVKSGINNNLTGDKYENPFPQPEFKLGLGNDATFCDKLLKELVIFFVHTWGILYRRFWWMIRDFRGICCQLLIPGALAAIGLGVIKLAIDTTYPSLDLTVNQWYDPSVYGAPFSNITNLQQGLSNDSNNPFVTNFTYFESIYDNYMSSSFGNLKIYSVNDFSDGTIFSEDLLDHASDTAYVHYNGWYIPPYDDIIMLGVNLSAYHSYPIAYNAYYNWILKSQFDTSASISITNHPLPQTTTESAFTDVFLGLFASLYLLIAFAFVPVGAIYQIVLDKVNLTKHQQFVSGMSFISYWVGNYIFDIFNALPAAGLVFIMVYIFDTESFQGEAAGPFILAILLFMFGITPFTYLLSYLFSNPSSSQRWTALLYIVLGLVLFITSIILDSINSVKDLNSDLKPLYRFFPTYLLADAVFSIALRDLLNPGEDYFKWDICGQSFMYLFYEGLGYFALLLLIEWLSHQPIVLIKLGLIKNTPKIDETLDEDVETESKRIKNAVIFDNENNKNFKLDRGKCDDSVVLTGLRKVYKRGKTDLNVAVKDLWFGVPQGQVFGFLGVNGAGKTTSLATLTGERFPSDGTAFINGYPITQQNIIRRFIGYCPQFDALFELLTGEEHLRFYGTLKGLSGKELDDQIEMLLKVLSLTKYRNRRAGTYSGGNKRKLSVAMSMIGNPPIIFLDEPSTGMDPVSRRHMWEFISKTMDGRAVILTTHSMEECEALCHRLAIMVAGQLRCIGTPQHLKTRFGHGYQLDMTLKNSEPSTRADVEASLLYLFNVRCLEVNRQKVTYELMEKEEYLKENGKMTLAQLFKQLEILKANKPIESYAVNQTSLEQIFLRMANESETEAAAATDVKIPVVSGTATRDGTQAVEMTET